MRLRGSLALPMWLALACGPTVGQPHDDAGGSGESGSGHATAATVSASSNASQSTTASSVTTASSESDETDAFRFDAGTPDVGGVDPPESCELPQQPNANLVGTTPFGDVSLHVAVYDHSGGGKCPSEYRVVVAVDADTLAAQIESYAMDLGPTDAVEIDLAIPPRGPEPGEWTGSMDMVRDGETWSSEVSAIVTAVPGPDDDPQVLQATVTSLDPQWSLHGPIAAPRCNGVGASACGA